MGSAAGTFVNGRRVSRLALGKGDQISVGGLRIVVDASAPPPPASASAAQPKAEAAPAPTPAHAPDVPELPADVVDGPLGAELRVYWGDTLLDARTFVAPPRPVRLLDAGEGALVVTHVRGEYAIVPPGGVEVPIHGKDAVRLALGEHLRVEARLRASAPPQETRWWERANWRFANLVMLIAFAGGAFLVAATAGLVARGPAEVPAPADDPLRLARFVAPPPAPRPVSKLAKGEIPKADDQKPGESGERHRGPEGQMGKRDAPKVQARSAPKAVDPKDSDVVKHQGLLAVLGSGKGAPEGLSTVLGRGGLGGDLKGAVGNMFGATVGDSFGFAGLGLKGEGQGGGGSGETIGIGAVGTKGRGGGMGGYGAGVGGLGKKGDRDLGLAYADPKVLGSIDPELIRRVIREHASQVRYCYEQQLALNPKLSGKVSIKWQINADGSASSTMVNREETTMPNDQVAACIMSRIVTWEFPKPRGGGIGVVTYPWILRPSGSSAAE
jgi:hypothetical protein